MARHIDGEWDLAQSNGFTVRMLISQPRGQDGNVTDGGSQWECQGGRRWPSHGGEC